MRLVTTLPVPSTETDRVDDPMARPHPRPHPRPDHPPPPPIPPPGGVEVDQVAFWRDRAFQLEAELTTAQARAAELAAHNRVGMERNENLIAKLQAAKRDKEHMDDMASKLRAAAEAEREASNLQRNQHRLKQQELQRRIETEIRQEHDQRPVSYTHLTLPTILLV